MLRQKEPRLEGREVFSEKGYRSENDAVHLMHRLSNQYEPVSFVFWRKEKKRTTKTGKK